MFTRTPFTRREFLQRAALAGGALLLPAWRPLRAADENVWPDSERLGRVCSVNAALFTHPDPTREMVRKLSPDDVLDWLQESVGAETNLSNSRRWVETSQGYVYAPLVQPVKYQPNQPLTELPEGPLGRGMWAEVSVPYLDITLNSPSPSAPWLKDNPRPRLYYSQVFWIDEIKTDADGQILYRAVEKYGYGDIFWVLGSGFRPLTREELDPIHPEAENKRVRVYLGRQLLVCLEDEREVYACRISSGVKYDPVGNPIDRSSTPLGAHTTNRKLISLHMSGGVSGGGWDLPGIAWTTLFSGGGEAVHSTYWHNDFGVPRSRGCVNARPEDAKWVFRWSLPYIPYDTGELTVSMPGGTIVEVVD